MKNYHKKKGKLVFEDGSTYESYIFGSIVSTSGEVVFTTSMTGYVESITDPSYKGQILVYTYPSIGNYGIPPPFVTTKTNYIYKFYESNKVQISGLVISYYSYNPYHWNIYQSLHKYLLNNKIPGLYGIDTRFIARKLRKKGGSMLGKILVGKEDLPFYDPNKYNLSDKVTINKKVLYGNGKYRILLLDFGVKNNILRSLLKRDCTIIRVPWNYDFTKEKYDGLLISNGPGNPKIYKKPIYYIQQAMKKKLPIFGICLGNQLLGVAAGGDTYKLKYAHRSHNQPVMCLKTGKNFITSQNHGYGLDPKNMYKKWKIFFINLNDNTCEGIFHEEKPFFSVQFHPEATSGPRDTEFLFDFFINLVDKVIK